MRLELEAFVSDECDFVEVFVVNTDALEICALSISVEYDPSLLSFVYADECEAFRDGFSCVDKDGCLKLLFDESKNVAARELVKLCFAVKDKSRMLEAEFYLLPSDPVAACRFSENAVMSIKVYSTFSVAPSPDERPIVSGDVTATVTGRTDGFSLISLVGYAPYGCMAAGFEASVIKLATSEIERFCTVSVLPISQNDPEPFESMMSVPDEGNICVIIRPIIYGRSGAGYGKEKFFVVINGEICE